MVTFWCYSIDGGTGETKQMAVALHGLVDGTIVGGTVSAVYIPPGSITASLEFNATIESGTCDTTNGCEVKAHSGIEFVFPANGGDPTVTKNHGTTPEIISFTPAECQHFPSLQIAKREHGPKLALAPRTARSVSK
jgi:hypothetical protein